MFLIEPFIWMFSLRSFKSHFLYLLLTAIICWGLSYVLFYFLYNSFEVNQLAKNIILIVILAISVLSPMLCLAGYFWCLTENIINRDVKAKLNNVYDGKPSFYSVIALPDWNIFTFIWRGFASLVATIIMSIPFALLLMLIIFNMSIFSSSGSYSPEQIYLFSSSLALLISLLVPGLLWNYASRDSVVAVLNFPKAIYLIESYPLKYFWNSFMMFIVYVAKSFITKFIVIVLGYESFISLNSASSVSKLLSVEFISIYAIIAAVSFVIDAYFIFVNAYLLGTIAPPSEY